MLKRDFLILAAVFLAALEILSWETASWPSSCVIQPSHKEQTYYQYSEKDCPTFLSGSLILLGRIDHFIESHDKSITASFTIILAISTIGLWSVTKRLWEAGERLAKRQERDTEIIQRAYLSVEPGGIVPFLDRSDRYSCDFVIHNAGNLPANNVMVFMQRTFSKNREFKPVNFKILEGPLVFAPKTRARASAWHLSKSRLCKCKCAAVNAAAKNPEREAWIFVWGRLTYHDGFRGDRWVEFCHRYNVAAATDSGIPAEGGRYHISGNRTDESKSSS